MRLVAALTTWPRDGVPQNPEAWLLTAARHSLIDGIRHRQVVLASEPTLQLLKESSMETTLSMEFPDERSRNCSSCVLTRQSTRRCTHRLCCRRCWAWMRRALPKPF